MNFFFNRKLAFAAAAVGIAAASFTCASFLGKNSSNAIEAEKLIIRNAKGKSTIELGFSADTPYISFQGPAGKTTLKLEGGDLPSLALNNDLQKSLVKVFSSKEKGGIALSDANGEARVVLESGKTADITILNDKNQVALALGTSAETGSAYVQLNDENQTPRVHLQGGSIPGFYLRNSSAKTISSWTTLSDGGAGFGLADANGSAAAILRGGASPSVSFFSAQNEPMAALGIIQKVPHLLISGPVGNEGILIHGGTPSSMLVVDEVGKIKILISKNGVFQGKEEGAETKKRENKVFSYDDNSMLFPEDDSAKR
jgi:hypothetical protein